VNTDFLRLHVSFDKARFAILPLPYDSTMSYKTGARDGPEAILRSSHFLEDYEPELDLDVGKIPIATLPPLQAVKSGPEEMLRKVERAALEVFQTGGKVLVGLGGEHSVTIGLVSAIGKMERFSVVYLDAHLDLRDRYEGTPLSHACVARRIEEVSDLVQIGTRSASREEADLVKEKGWNPLFAEDILRLGDPWYTEVVDNLQDKVYITIDLDVFDPSIVPCVGTPEPGGLGFYDVMRLLKEVARRKKVLGFDVVELNPSVCDSLSSAFLAAKLVFKLIAYIDYFSNAKKD
jgi:agmatinase